MPLWRPPQSRDFRRATGGTGLEGLSQPSSFQPETHVGSTAFLEQFGVVSEREVFRISAGEQTQHVIPQGERVIVTFTAQTQTGLVDVEREAVDLGRGVLDVLREAEAVAAAEAAAVAAAEAAAQAALGEALAAGLADGSLVATGPLGDPNTQIIPAPPPPPPQETAPPPPEVGADQGGVVSEQPVGNPSGSTSTEDQPTGGCETVTDVRVDEFGNIYDVVLHFDGSQYNEVTS